MCEDGTIRLRALVLKTKIELESSHFKMSRVDAAASLSRRMRLALYGVSCMAWLFSNVSALAQTAKPGNLCWLRPSAIAVDKDSQFYVLCPGANEVRLLEPEKKKENSIPVLSQSTGVNLDAKSQKLYVTSSDNTSRSGSVCVYQLPKGNLIATWTAGYGVTSPVLSHDRETLFVCNQFDGTAAAYNTKDGSKIFVQRTSSLPNNREPISLDVTPDGSLLAISHSLPGVAANSKTVASSVSILEARNGNFLHEIKLPNGSVGLRDIRISPCGKYAVVVHLLARFSLPATHVDRGWMNSNVFTLINMGKKEHICTFLLDQIDCGAANPWGVSWSADGNNLYITHAGTHELSVIHFDKLIEKLTSLSEQEKSYLYNNFSFLNELRERISLVGNAPRSLCVSDNKIYVAHYFSDSVDIVDCNNLPPTIENISLKASNINAKKPEVIPIYWGERLFNEAKLCYQEWQSCASCHSYDARIDGLNWDLINDGIGNPKNTKSLLFSHKTPPSMSTGIRPTAEMAVRSGIRYILFKDHTEFEAEAIDEYLKSIQPLPSPHLNKMGKLTDEAEKGKKLFESPEVGCTRCHSGIFFTDTEKYDVGTSSVHDKPHQLFDTPTLIEIWRTAPYLHDGSALTIYEMLTARNPQNIHGNTKHLTEAELRALEAYLLSL